MKKTVLFIIITVIIYLLYWTLSNLFFPIPLNEKIEDLIPANIISTNQETSPEQLLKTRSQGLFLGSGNYLTTGQVKILNFGNKNYLRLESDFKITKGPQLVILLGANNRYDSNAKIANLKGFVGSQNYEIPSGINLDKYDEVWIWCDIFATPFGYAKLSKL